MTRMTNAAVLEELNVTLSDDRKHFLCAITYEVMDDPVIDPCTLIHIKSKTRWSDATPEEQANLDCWNFKEVPRYDRSTLVRLKDNKGKIKGPSTRLPFSEQQLVSDTKLKSEIDLFIHHFREHLSRLYAEAEEVAETKAAFFRLKMQFARGIRLLSPPSRAVNPILQQIVYGNANVVRAALEAVKDNSAQLSALLSDTGTVKDYSDRTITRMTLLQAAAASGDIDMCLMLKNYMSPEEFATQLVEIFPEGIEAHEAHQQRNAFNFASILATIRSAENTHDLDAALNKTDNDSALCRALEEFRRQFSELSNNEKIFNPQHLLLAFEAYNALWDQCEREDNDRDYKKRNLSWRQIIGYTQRFMPACYAQAFAQGLDYLVKVNDQDKAGQYASCRPEAFRRDLKLSHDDFSYFPLDSRSGLGFDFAIYGMTGSRARTGAPLRAWRTDCALFSKTFVEQKHQAFRTLCRELECGHASSLMNVVA